MNVVAYGGGADSTAMLIECYNRGIQIDLILFADTGGEKPHTYEYIKTFNEWLKSHDMPEVTTVKPTKSLESDCLERNSLPSLAFGFKTRIKNTGTRSNRIHTEFLRILGESSF